MVDDVDIEIQAMEADMLSVENTGSSRWKFAFIFFEAFWEYSQFFTIFQRCFMEAEMDMMDDVGGMEIADDVGNDMNEGMDDLANEIKNDMGDDGGGEFWTDLINIFFYRKHMFFL